MVTLSSFANLVVILALVLLLGATFLGLVTPNEILMTSMSSCVLALLSMKLSKDAIQQVNRTSQAESIKRETLDTL